MRKIYLLLCLLVVATWSVAQVSEIKFTTSKEYGDDFAMWPKSTSKGDTIKVDWGDGEIKKYSIDPNGFDFATKVNSAIKGDTIRIFTKLVKLDIQDVGLTSLSLIDQPLLKQLLANGNELTSANCILDGAVNLENVDLSKNKLTILDMRAFQNLIYFDANENESLGSVLFADGCATLEGIGMSDCDISHFYPISLPKLASLKLANNALMDLEIADWYPALTSLDVSGNAIQTIDVKACSKLFTLNVAGNQLTEIDVTQNPELVQLYCSDNRIKKLNLFHNPALTNLSCANNGLADLNVSKLPKLTDLTCGGNLLKRLDLSNNFYLSNLICNDNLLEFLDFTGNPGLNKVDCRNNSNMTACTLNYMFSTMLARYREAYSPNLLIAGCNGETADTDEINSSDMNWKTDVKGDGTAVCDSVAITLQVPDNGSYQLTQPSLYGKDYKEIKTKAMVGTPVKVVPAPAADYKYKSVVVNDKEIADTLFVIGEAAEIAVNFESTLIPYMTLNTSSGTPLTFGLTAAADNTEITIDWGDGLGAVFTIGTKEKFIDGTATGETVKITGEITEADFASYPEVAWDNKLTGIDVSHNPGLISLSTYMNPIETLNVGNCKDLINLDCAYSELAELDVTANEKLAVLQCYNNKLSILDVSHCPDLTKLVAKGNSLTELNIAANPGLTLLDVQGNQLQQIDVEHLANLTELRVDNNKLTALDVTHNEKLWLLALSGNKLTTLDLSKNEALCSLLCADNELESLDLSHQKLIYSVNCEGNGMTACALNDLYYSLPQYPTLDEPLKTFALWVKGDKEATWNDAEHAESIIAKGKGWTINYEGDGSGCNEAYITIRESENGAVQLLDSKHNPVVSGDKVEKNSVITVQAEPAEGYMVESVKVNGKSVDNGTFTVERSTEVVAKFTLTIAIDEVGQTITVSGIEGGLLVDTPVSARLSVYTTSGVLVCRKDVSGCEKIALDADMYVVTLDAGDKRVAKTMIVR